MQQLDAVDAGGSGPGVMSSLWRHRRFILYLMALSALAAYVYAYMQPKQYTARGMLLLSSDRPFDPLGVNQTLGQPDRWVVVQTQFLTSDDVILGALASLPPALTAEKVRRAIEVDPVTDANQIFISGTAATPDAAADIVNAVLASYREVAGARTRRQANVTLRGVADPNLRQQVQLRVAVYGDGVALAQEAGPPRSPSAPLPNRSAAVAALVGLLAGCASAVGRESLRWARKENTTEAPGDPVRLPVVPVSNATVSVVSDPDSAAAEAYRIAYYALGRLMEDGARRPFRSLLVTSFDSRESAAQAAANLAAVAAESGARVLLVDADEDGAGVLALSAGTGQRAVHAPATDDGLLEPCGRPWLRAPEVDLPVIGLPQVRREERRGPFSQAELSQLMADYQREFDIVVIDAAPLTSSPQSFVLAGHADAGVVVLGAHAPLDDSARRRIALSGLNILGLLPQDPPRRFARKEGSRRGALGMRRGSRRLAPTDKVARPSPVLPEEGPLAGVVGGR